jgi:hypothetical protein
LYTISILFAIFVHYNLKYELDYDGGFILQKDVNWSLLTEGLAIPTSVCSRFADWDATILTHGASKPWLIGPIVQHPSSIMTMNAPLARASLPNAKLTVSILAKSLIV